MGVHWKDWCWSSNSNPLATWWEELTHCKRPWWLERLRAGGEGDDRGWDGWMASPTRWTWVRANSERWLMDTEAGCAVIHRVAKSRTWLRNWTELKSSSKCVLQMYRTEFWTLREKERVRYFGRTASKHVCYQVWNRSPTQVGFMREVLRAGALGRPRGMGWGGRMEWGSGWGIHVNPWLIHVNVWQKPLQYCKVISLQQII